MDHPRKRLSESQPPRGIAGDVHRLKQNGTASLAELREFVGELKGRSPEEVLGLVTGSGLVRGIVMSTAAFLVVIAAFTVVPYAISGPPKPKVDPIAETKAKADAAKAAEESKTDSPAATDAGKTSEPDVKNAAKALKIDEVKGTNPKDSPDLDNLLDKKFE